MSPQGNVQKHANLNGIQDRVERWIAYSPFVNAFINSMLRQELQLHGAQKSSKVFKSTYDIVKEKLDTFPKDESLKRKAGVYKFLHDSHYPGRASDEGIAYVHILEESLGNQKQFERVTNPDLLQQTANEIRWAYREVERARERLPKDIEAAVRRTLVDPPAKNTAESA